MKTNYRLLLSHAFAKLGDKNQKQLLGYYDKLSAKYGEDEAISMLYEAFRQLQEATASTSYKNLLSDTAKSIWNALDGKTIAVKTAIQRYREALQKAKSQEGKELEVEIGGKPQLGLYETKEVLRENGMLERHRVYKATASEKDSGLEIEVRI